ncbi:hypothetical protein Tco_1485104 [Tanacetum coccineum]
MVPRLWSKKKRCGSLGDQDLDCGACKLILNQVIEQVAVRSGMDSKMAELYEDMIVIVDLDLHFSVPHQLSLFGDLQLHKPRIPGYSTPDSSTLYRTVVDRPSFSIFLMLKNLSATKSTNEEDPPREEPTAFFLAFARS